jgi:hypothetical protein
VFQSIGIVGTSTSFLTTGIFGVVKTAITIIFIMFLIETVGRRWLLIIGSVGGSMCMWFIGAYIKVANSNQAGTTASTANPPPLTSGGIAAVFFFYLWTAFYSPTWNPMPWVINSEIYPYSARNLGQAWAAANNWFWNFIIR